MLKIIFPCDISSFLGSRNFHGKNPLPASLLLKYTFKKSSDFDKIQMMNNKIEKSKLPGSLFDNIKKLLQDARKSVVQTINSTMVYTYFEIGRMIVEDQQKGKERAEYGKETLKTLSKRLTEEFGKGFSVYNLERMRNFYNLYKSRISASAMRNSKNPFKLSWTHYLKLLSIEDDDERRFYEIECKKGNWSVRELQRQFNSALYERLVLSRDKTKIKELSEKGQIIEGPVDVIKDPYVLEFLALKEEAPYTETDMEAAIIDKLEDFMLELGKGFLFAGRQKRFSFENTHFYVDLVFYNRLLKCFVLFDLKIGSLTHQDIGQMQMYVNYYDRIIKTDEENKTIGIILCKETNHTVVKFTLPEDNDQIFASKYKLYLPTKEELSKQLEHI